MAQAAGQELRMEVRGMTCTGCEEHVVQALTRAGATAVTADFRRGEARFRLPAGVKADVPREAVAGSGYETGE